MPRVVTPLTHKRIENAQPKESEYNLSDGMGLVLRIKPSGSKSWLFNYQTPYQRKRTNISFGQFPEVSLLQAREQRSRSRELLAQQIDPKKFRDNLNRAEEEAHQNTLRSVADRWFDVRQSTISQGYAIDVYNSLANHVFPKLGNKPLHLITAPDAIEVLQPVADRGNLELVRRICQRLNMVMDYAVNTGVVTANPLSGIRKAFRPPKKRHFPTIRPEQLSVLLNTVQNHELETVTYHLMLWQLHTMLRPSEAAKTRWQEIDAETNLWVIPAERMKMKRPHTVPLSRQMLAILNAMRSISGHREFVFPGRNNPKKPRNSQSLNVALKRMGYQGQLVSHGLRAVASTYLNEQGVDPRVVETALSHVEENETIRAYNRAGYLPQVRDALQLWSDFIEASMPPTISN